MIGDITALFARCAKWVAVLPFSPTSTASLRRCLFPSVRWCTLEILYLHRGENHVNCLRGSMIVMSFVCWCKEFFFLSSLLALFLSHSSSGVSPHILPRTSLPPHLGPPTGPGHLPYPDSRTLTLLMRRRYHNPLLLGFIFFWASTFDLCIPFSRKRTMD